jgi:hypothetical protein
MKRVIAYREAQPPVFAIRCDPAHCAARVPPPEPVGAHEAWLRGWCDPKGCYLGASLTPEGRASIAAAHGYVVTPEASTEE